MSHYLHSTEDGTRARLRIVAGDAYGEDQWIGSARCRRCGYVPMHPTLPALATACTFRWDGQGFTLYFPHPDGHGGICEAHLTPLHRESVAL